jgi:hypothetical protein
MRGRPCSILTFLLATALACSGSSSSAPIVCAIDQSGDACFRCQAQRCAGPLDHCYGPGFHEGRSVGTVDVPCGPLAACQQSCGCAAGCDVTCARGLSDAAVPTGQTRYEPALCTDCVSTYIAACVRRSCAAECGTDGGL